MTFRPEIDLGQVLSLLVFLLTVMVAYGNIRAEVAEIKTKVNAMWVHFIHPGDRG